MDAIMDFSSDRLNKKQKALIIYRKICPGNNTKAYGFDVVWPYAYCLLYTYLFTREDMRLRDMSLS